MHKRKWGQRAYCVKFMHYVRTAKMHNSCGEVNFHFRQSIQYVVKKVDSKYLKEIWGFQVRNLV